MKTVLFVHDGYMSQTENGIYSDTYDDKIVMRYSEIAENVVFLVRTRKYSDYDKRLNKITVRNFRMVGIENFKSLKGIFNYRSITEKVKLEVLKSDYVVARIPSDLGFLAVKYAKLYNVKYMVEIVGCPWDSLRNHSLLGKIIAPYYYLKQKETVKNAPYAIYVTNVFLQNRYPCKGNFIGCSDVEIEDSDEKVLVKRLNKINTTDIHSMTLGTIGAFHMKYKGYDTVIRAIVKLNSEGCSHKYLILGSGDPRWLNSVIRKYHAENIVTLVPAMPHNEVFAWLDEIDIYIQPSKTEGMPRALIEAMSRACPCISSDVGGMPELLGNKFLFKKNNDRELYEILKLNKEQLTTSSIECFNVADTYSKELVYQKRIDFMRIFSCKNINHYEYK